MMVHSFYPVGQEDSIELIKDSPVWYLGPSYSSPNPIPTGPYIYYGCNRDSYDHRCRQTITIHVPRHVILLTHTS